MKKGKKIEDNGQQSRFTGSAIVYLFVLAALYLGTVFSLCIAYPWLACMQYRWEAKYTYIDGKQTVFDGKGSDLFKKYIKWLLLTIVTLTIYKICLTKNVMMWKAEHTHFADGTAAESYYKCGLKEKIFMLIKYYAIIICTLTFGTCWAYCYKTRWTLNHTAVEGQALDFDGSGIQLFGKICLTILLILITLGIYILWLPATVKRWEAKHTHTKNYLSAGNAAA